MSSNKYRLPGFVPMAASKALPDVTIAATRWAALATARPPADPHYWLVLNECENETQCNMTPQQAADFYRNLVIAMSDIDPDARLIVGGVNASPCGVLWLKNFVVYYEDNYGEVPRAGRKMKFGLRRWAVLTPQMF